MNEYMSRIQHFKELSGGGAHSPICLLQGGQDLQLRHCLGFGELCSRGVQLTQGIVGTLVTTVYGHSLHSNTIYGNVGQQGLVIGLHCLLWDSTGESL